MLAIPHSVTEESSWDPPEEGYNPPPEQEETSADPDAKESEQPAEALESTDGEQKEPEKAEYEDIPMEDAEEDQGPEEDQVQEGEASVNPSSSASDAWVAYDDDGGREYYYNTVTGETQWEKPEGVQVKRPDEEDEGGHQEVDAQPETEEMDQEEPAEFSLSPSQAMAGDASPTSDVHGKQDEAIEQDVEQEKVDPAVKRLHDAVEALNQTDSVMEPNCMSNVSEVVTSEGGNPQKAITALIDSYQGQAAICGLLGRWLADMRSDDKEKEKGVTALSAKPSESNADKIREVAQNVVFKIAKERFSKETGDGILNLSKSEAAFLEEMMDSPRWRRLLIELSASHKDSAVLVYCLRAISKRGHHREISKRVNQSDHFAVFNAMLLSELAIVGSLAVSAGSDPVSSVGLEELVNDLQRACSSTSYTYLYSVELLRHLEDMTRRDYDTSPSSRFGRVLRKWEAMYQSLEALMMDPDVSSSVAGSSSLFRKRRLEVALTISNLHQSQRKRQRYDDDHFEAMIGSDRQSENALETALLTFLRRHAVGVQVDDSALDPLLPQGLDLETASKSGRLLTRHPLAIRAILSYLFKPGSTRVTSPVVRNKCARLVALAAIASEKSALESLQNQNGNDDASFPEVSDEVALTRMILDGSQLCEHLESMVSFLVTTSKEKEPTGSASSKDSTKSPTSSGEKLCALAIKNAVVAQGVAIWARAFTHGPEFFVSASFPTLSVSILSLARIVGLAQPFTRHDVMEVAMVFLMKHANPDISYQKINAIKEQSLRLLIHLAVRGGEMASVFTGVTNLLKDGGGGSNSEMDASLVRYFVCGILEAVQPPVSMAFATSFANVLMTPKCLDAVRSSYFGEEHRKRLVTLLQSFQRQLDNQLKRRDNQIGDGNGASFLKPLSKSDQSLISSLLSAYQVKA